MNEFFSTNLGVAVILLGQTLAVVGFVMISLLFLVYGDRKIWAAVQMRRGPNVVGLFGLLQTVADALKYVVKEIVIPAGADRPVFILAPLVSFVLAMLAWVVSAQFDVMQHLGLGFVLLSLVTLPHVVVMDGIYRADSHR